MTSFRVDIPKFCKDVEIVEAGTVTEGVFDQAAANHSDDHSYEVNQGQGNRISAVELSLNGPSTLSCAIPIFATFADSSAEE